MTQAIEWEMKVPTPNLREHWRTKSKRTAMQRVVTRRALESMAKRPARPAVTVRLTRISTVLADSDRAALALDTVRDEVARWIYGLPEYEIRRGVPRVPRAPDGPSSAIRWAYSQAKTRHRIVDPKTGRKRGWQGVRIEIIETIEGAV